MEIEHVDSTCSCIGKRCADCSNTFCILCFPKNSQRKSRNKRCRACFSQYKYAWAKAHPEVTRKAQSKYRRSDKYTASEHIKQRRRENAARWNKAHPEVIKASIREHKQNNRDQYILWVHTHRTRKTQAGGSYTLQEWEALKAQYNYQCLCCGKQEPDIKLSVDHIIPVSKGGTSYIENIQPLCRSCNTGKRNKIIDYRPDYRSAS